MGTSTFSGPVNAGPVKNTTGTTPASDMANVGTVVLSQYENVNQNLAAANTSIVIPPNSIITSIYIVPTVAFVGNPTFQVGKDGSGTGLGSVSAVAAGKMYVDPTTAAMGSAAVFTTGARISVKSSQNGAGVGRLVVEYIQTA